MANDDFFDVDDTWQPVEANAAEIQAGTFSVVNHSDKLVYVMKFAGTPTHENGAFGLNFKFADAKYTLAGAERLYARTVSGVAILGVIPA